MTFSVVCPTFNASADVGTALACVLQQEHRPLEMIVADDGSNDDTLATVRAWAPRFAAAGVALLAQAYPHGGPAVARNHGIDQARGDWIAFLDADDVWLPAKLQRVAAAAAARPAANLWVHWEEYHRLDGSRQVLRNGSTLDPAQPLPRQLYQVNSLSTSAVVVRRDLLRQVGGFDPAFKPAEDYELWLRLAPHCTLGVVPEVLGHYVETPHSLTSRPYLGRYLDLVHVLWRHRDHGGWWLFLRRLTAASLTRRWLTMIRHWFSGEKRHY